MNIDYKLILNAMFDDLAIVDEKGIMIYVSQGFERNYNVSKDMVIGKTVDEMETQYIFSPSVAKIVFQNRARVITSHKNKKGNYVIVHGIPVFEGKKIKYVVSYAISSQEITTLQQEKDLLKGKLEEYQTALEKLKSTFQSISHNMTDLHGSKNALQTIRKIKQYDVSVLFTGESGVGKTTYAKYLHDNGPRSKGPFIEISCGSIPENLLESELFGYAEGSFTGASKKGKLGLIETANNGTLFLDEIADLPINLQSKILKTLQKKTITRLGETKERSVDFRLITATNKDLKQMIKDGTFREDLFYRIAVIPIEIPPLRKRPEDMITLVKFFMDKFNLKYNETKVISADAVKAMAKYPWTGNIRELENTIEQLVIMSEGKTIVKEDLPDKILSNQSFSLSESFSKDSTLETMMGQYESLIIGSAYEKYKTTVEVAKALGISQPTASRKIKAYLKKTK